MEVEVEVTIMDSVQCPICKHTFKVELTSPVNIEVEPSDEGYDPD